MQFVCNPGQWTLQVLQARQHRHVKPGKAGKDWGKGKPGKADKDWGKVKPGKAGK